MANSEHLKILKQGVEVWNKWRELNDDIVPDLNSANFQNAKLSGVNLSGANLNGASFFQADLPFANLVKANLKKANIEGAFLPWANFKEADLSEANLKRATLIGTNFEDANLAFANFLLANLNRANLQRANLFHTELKNTCFVDVNLEGANISNSYIYGISAWNLKTNQKTKQHNLVITQNTEPTITVDDLEIAQFVYLLLHNEKIRSVIDTIGEKGVLILGRFTPERKAVLDAIRNKLRELGFVPMMFDFEKPTQRDFTETIKTLAGMSRFIIADITNPKSAPLELQATMPDYMIPFVPIIQEGEEPFSMFRDLKQKYSAWVLDVLEYDSAESLIDVMDNAVVQPALDKAYELIDRKAEDLKKRHVRDYKKKLRPPSE
jgi:uncharacterized protein YjbI with pentapeptide repeats